MIAVNDAWLMCPFADVLYANDANWWQLSGPPPGAFNGERWSSHEVVAKSNNQKTEAAAKYGLELVGGRDEYGFSIDHGIIHYGGNSGFQAINLAIQFGATLVFLAGFDLRIIEGRGHFFGDHPPGLHNSDARDFSHRLAAFETAARTMPPGVRVVNCTPDSALTCFERGTL